MALFIICSARPHVRIPSHAAACCSGEAPSVWKKRKESSPYSPFLYLRPATYTSLRIGSDAGFSMKIQRVILTRRHLAPCVIRRGRRKRYHNFFDSTLINSISPSPWSLSPTLLRHVSCLQWQWRLPLLSMVVRKELSVVKKWLFLCDDYVTPPFCLMMRRAPS